MPCSAFRWTLQIEAFRWRVAVGLYHQFQTRSDGQWHTSHTTLYDAQLGFPIRFGTDHWYYDGPHCSLELGLLHFNWCGRDGWCDKCYGPTE